MQFSVLTYTEQSNKSKGLSRVDKPKFVELCDTTRQAPELHEYPSL